MTDSSKISHRKKESEIPKLKKDIDRDIVSPANLKRFVDGFNTYLLAMKGGAIYGRKESSKILSMRLTLLHFIEKGLIFSQNVRNILLKLNKVYFSDEEKKIETRLSHGHERLFSRGSPRPRRNENTH